MAYEKLKCIASCDLLSRMGGVLGVQRFVGFVRLKGGCVGVAHNAVNLVGQKPAFFGGCFDALSSIFWSARSLLLPDGLDVVMPGDRVTLGLGSSL